MGAPDIAITVRGLTESLTVPTGALYTIQVTRFNAELFEMEDVHFHFDSAVLLPDFKLTADPDADDADRVTGLAVLRACLLHAQQTSDLLLIAGHTDTSGPTDVNLTLSKQRADNVFYVLTGDRDGWVASCQKKHKVEDYQQILKWVAQVWEWDCDPGEVDNSPGPKTRAATKEFQRSYNLDFSASIAEDGAVGAETWGAFFDVYTEVLKLILETDDQGLAAFRGKLQFVDSGKPTVGCGENFPIEAPRRDNYRSRINRRVELLFFNPAELPTLNCHAGKGIKKDDCDIYQLHHFRFHHFPVPPITIKTLKRWVIRLLKPGSGPPAKRDPLGNLDYVVTGAGGPTPEIKGQTDAKGVVRIQVTDDPCVMTLKIAGLEFKVQAGTLKKVREGDDAARQRLHNMAYGPDDLPSWSDEDFSSALKVFQKDHGIPETGRADDATRDRLRQEHGS